jgi:hypothetical protein
MKIKTVSSRLLFIFLTAVLMFGMIFSGCAARSDFVEEVSEEAEMPVPDEKLALETPEVDMDVAEEQTAEARESEAAYNNEAQYGDTAVAGERKVIKTAYIDIEIESGKFEEAMFELTALAEQNGGFVARSESYSDSEGNLTSGYITIRVPSNKYNSALDKIKAMGTIKSISSSGQDITQEYVDLESRLRNYQAQEEVLLDLMAQSKRVSDSLEVQKELNNVQGEIEVIKGRMNYLDNMVSFSTIDVYFHEPEPIKTASDWGFVQALKRGLRGAVTAFNWMIMALIATAPVWIVIGILLIIIWQIIRARKRRAGKEKK